MELNQLHQTQHRLINFDIHREDFQVSNPMLPLFAGTSEPTKVEAFEADLRKAILARKCPDERTIVEICFDHGMRRQHAEPVLAALKSEGAIQCEFRVPQIKTFRAVKLLAVEAPFGNRTLRSEHSFRH